MRETLKAMLICFLTSAYAADICKTNSSMELKTQPDPKAFIAKYRQINRHNIDTTTVLVEAVPSGFVNNTECIDKLVLEMKTDDDKWIEVKKTSEDFQWSIDTIPCRKNSFLLRLLSKYKDMEEIEIRKSVGPANMDGFIPEPPTNITITGHTLSWNPSDCADKYEININKNGANLFQNLTDQTKIELKEYLEPCANYTYDLFAKSKDRYSEKDTTDTFKTGPNEEELAKIKPAITSTEASITATWGIPASLFCLEEMSLFVCYLETCKKSEQFHINRYSNVFKSNVKELSHSTLYTIVINATYNGNQLAAFEEQFATKPKIENVRASNADSGKNIMLTWAKSNTAEKYEIYHKKAKPQNLKGELVGVEVENQTVVYPEGCTESWYGIVAVDSNKFSSKIKWTKSPISIGPSEKDLATIQPIITSNENSANITWKTPKWLNCVDHFMLKCLQPKDCRNIERANKETFLFNMKNLTHSTNYTIHIKASYKGKLLSVKELQFLTNPKIETIQINKTDDLNIILYWPKTETAKKYVIYRKFVGASLNNIEEIETITDMKVEINQKICIKAQYGIMAVDGENTESAVTWTDEVHIPHANCSHITQAAQTSKGKPWDLTIVILTGMAVLVLVVVIFLLKSLKPKKQYGMTDHREEGFRHRRSAERMKPKTSLLSVRSTGFGEDSQVHCKALKKVKDNKLDDSLDEVNGKLDDYLEVANNSLDEIVDSLDETNTSYKTAITNSQRRYWSDGNMYI